MNYLSVDLVSRLPAISRHIRHPLDIYYAVAKVIFAERFPEWSFLKTNSAIRARAARRESSAPSKHSPRQIMRKAVRARREKRKERKARSKVGTNTSADVVCGLSLKYILLVSASLGLCLPPRAGLFIRAYAVRRCEG